MAAQILPSLIRFGDNTLNLFYDLLRAVKKVYSFVIDSYAFTSKTFYGVAYYSMVEQGEFFGTTYFDFLKTIYPFIICLFNNSVCESHRSIEEFFGFDSEVLLISDS